MPERGFQKDNKERRRYKRQRLTLDAMILGRHPPARAYKVRDFCPGGLFLAQVDPPGSHTLAKGEEVQAKFSIPLEGGRTQSVEVFASVARVFDDGVGIAFIEPDPKVLRALKDLAVRQKDKLRSVRRSERSPGSQRERILSECKTVFRRHLTATFEEFCQKADEQLFACARDANNNLEQTIFFDGRKEFAAVAARIQADTVGQLVTGMDSLGNSHASTDPGFDAGETMNLSLLEKDEFEDFLAVSEIIGNAERSYKDPLFGLTKRFSVLVGAPVEKEDLAIGPNAVCRAFSDMFTHTSLKREVLKVLYQIFERHFISRLGDLYSEMNQVLIDNEVLTDLDTQPRYSRPRQESVGRPPPGVDGGRYSDASLNMDQTAGMTPPPYGMDGLAATTGWAAVQDAFETVRSLRAGVSSASDVDSSMSLTTSTQLYGRNEVSEALSLLQGELLNRPHLTSSQYSDRLATVLASHHGAGKQLSSHQRGAIDMVGRMVDSIEDDHQLGSLFKGQVRGLQTALSQMAIADQGPLGSRPHPAWGAIGQVAELDARVGVDDPMRAQVEAASARIEQEIAANGAVSTASHELLQQLRAGFSQRSDERVQQLIQQCQAEQSLLKSKGKDPTATGSDDTLHSGTGVHPMEWKVWLDRAKQLEAGDALELTRGKEASTSARLVWTDKGHSRFVFADAAGEKVASMDLQELAKRLQRGSARVMEPQQQGPMQNAARNSLFRLHESVEEKSQHDSITGLLNLEHFSARLHQALECVRQEGIDHVLLYGNLNCLRLLQERWGEEVADTLLRDVARIILEYKVRPGLVARLKDDRFGLLLEHCNVEDGVEFARGLGEILAGSRFQWEHQKFRITMAIGVVPLQAEEKSVATLLERAMQASDDAKRARGNRVKVHEQAADGGATPRQKVDWPEWFTQVNAAREIPLFSQPAAPLMEGDSAGRPLFEIRAGLVVEGGDVVFPGSVMSNDALADKVREFEQLLIRETLAWMGRDRDEWSKFECCIVNLSAHSLADDGMVEFMLRQFSEIAVPPGRICFQIAQDTAKTQLDETERVLRTMREFGCRFSLDNFSGQDLSQGYLDRLPVDYLRIDRVFIQGALEHSEDYALVKSVNGIGHLMGKKTIAKGVADDQTLEIMRELGVDYAQGLETPRRLGAV